MAETQTRFTTQGLVIKEMNKGENDRFVVLLTREYGILKAYVPGAKSIKSKRSSATALLTYSDFAISRKGEFYRITEAQSISSFFTTGLDIDILSLAQYFCENVPDIQEARLFLYNLQSFRTRNKTSH